MLSPETIKRSADVQKTLQLIYSIFHYHSNLFFLDDTQKSYFIFLTDILIKLSQTDFVGPRLLATQIGKPNLLSVNIYYETNILFLFRFKNNNWFGGLKFETYA